MYGVNNGISVGLKTQIWPFMWKTGHYVYRKNKIITSELRKSRIAVSNLNKYADLNAKWNIVRVFQEKDKNFNYTQLKKIVNEHKKRGIKVVFRVLERPEVYDNLSDKSSKNYGYNKKYYTWVHHLAETFKNDVKYFLISNEAESDHAHNYYWMKKKKRSLFVTYNQYRKVLVTAYDAIKNVNPNLQVVDYGASSFTLGLAVAHSIMKNKGINAALKFWNDFYVGHGSPLWGKLKFYHMINKTEILRRIYFLKESLKNPGPSDYFQLHHYRSWRTLNIILNWLQNEMTRYNTERPLFAAEIGYLWPIKDGFRNSNQKTKSLDVERYDEQTHAEYIVKDFTILFGSGVKMALYWFMQSSHDFGAVARLYMAPDKLYDLKPTKAALAYKVLAGNLNGLYVDHTRKNLGSGIWEYSFTGDRSISVVWADSSSVTISFNQLDLPEMINDIYGNVIQCCEAGKLIIEKSPVYIHWRNKYSISTVH